MCPFPPSVYFGKIDLDLVLNRVDTDRPFYQAASFSALRFGSLFYLSLNASLFLVPILFSLNGTFAFNSLVNCMSHHCVNSLNTCPSLHSS